jgi:hypothetical protein
MIDGAPVSAELLRHEAARSSVGIITAGGWWPSSSFLDRLRASYRISLEGFVPETSVIWSDNSFISLRQSVHDALIGERNDLADLLANPKTTNLYYGVDNLALNIPAGKDQADAEAIARLADLQRLGVALGILRLWNPGGGSSNPMMKPQEPLRNADELVSQLPEAFDFPSPFPGEIALTTCRGPATHRAIQAIYQAHRLGQIARLLKGHHCLEIGAGMGRTAYYGYRLGLHDYTIVDLPTALVGQACFLAATLGEGVISLPGEEPGSRIKLRPPKWIDETTEQFDIALNVDSLTEMSDFYARKYVEFIRANSRSFLSINHEANDFTARDAMGDLFSSRHLYPMRDGYVEELAIADGHVAGSTTEAPGKRAG